MLQRVARLRSQPADPVPKVRQPRLFGLRNRTAERHTHRTTACGSAVGPRAEASDRGRSGAFDRLARM